MGSKISDVSSKVFFEELVLRSLSASHLIRGREMHVLECL